MSEHTDTELNELVAAKIMGWEIIDYVYMGFGGDNTRQCELEEEGWFDHAKLYEVGRYAIDHKNGTFHGLPNDMDEEPDKPWFCPANDVAQALQAAEKMGLVKAEDFGVKAADARWLVCIKDDHNTPYGTSAWESNIMRGLCVAALRKKAEG